MTEGAVPFIAALGMAAVHLFADRLRFLDGLPRSRWLSIAGGISVAYIVVHLLPELAEYQEATASSDAFGAIERHVYVFALAGVITFYGVELWGRRSRDRSRGREATAVVSAFSIGTYAAYNSIIGYLLVHREEGVALFAVALGLHFIVNDRALRDDHPTTYQRYGRWVLSAAVVGGVVLGYLTEVPQIVVALALAFIGGGTILNVLKEELPEERESRFGAFALGAAAYTAVLLAI